LGSSESTRGLRRGSTASTHLEITTRAIRGGKAKETWVLPVACDADAPLGSLLSYQGE
jgi:hypothetical protein